MNCDVRVAVHVVGILNSLRDGPLFPPGGVSCFLGGRNLFPPSIERL